MSVKYIDRRKEEKTDNNYKKVSILMAIYNPNYCWLIEQLISLNNQSYRNIELLIYDDCPGNPVDEQIIKMYISKLNFTLIRGKTNVGSNKAFEILTQMGNGEYFAYCDQDDIWENNKIEMLVASLEKNNSVMAYSDMSVIDESSKDKYDTLLQAKPMITYSYGDNILDKVFFKNCVSGCCMLIKSEVARYALPFSNTTIHDHWICIVASLHGNISFIKQPLVKYRMHGNNQTGSLKGIKTKTDYYKLKVNVLPYRLKDLRDIIRQKNIKLSIEETKQLKYITDFCNARDKRNIIDIFTYKELCKVEAYFEILIKYMPSFFVNYIFRILK